MPLPLRLSEPGPILNYLSFLRTVDVPLHDATLAAVRAVLATPDGAILLDLLEKSCANFSQPILSDPRALEARNAQSFIPLDLRRVMSNEIERLRDQANKSARGR